MFFEVAYRKSIRIVGARSRRFTHARSFGGGAAVPANASGAPSRRTAKTMRTITVNQFAAVAGGGASVLAMRCRRSRAVFTGTLKRISRSACWRVISGAAVKRGDQIARGAATVLDCHECFWPDRWPHFLMRVVAEGAPWPVF